MKQLILWWQSGSTADTTDLGYRIGYQIGSWLPFLIIVGLAAAIIIRSARLASRKEESPNNRH